MNKIVAVLLMTGSWMVGGPIERAQTTSSPQGTTHVISDQDVNLLRKDLRSKRRQLIAANLKLTDAEAAKFWPVYDQYVTELIAINDKKFGLIQDYADIAGFSQEAYAPEGRITGIRSWMSAVIRKTSFTVAVAAVWYSRLSLELWKPD